MGSEDWLLRWMNWIALWDSWGKRMGVWFVIIVRGWPGVRFDEMGGRDEGEVTERWNGDGEDSDEDGKGRSG